MKIVQADTYSELYKNALDQLLNNPEHNDISPRGQRIKEIEDMFLILNNPYSNLFKNDYRNIPIRYLMGEFVWYFSGRRDVKFIDKFSSFWRKLSDDGKNVNSAYGDLIFSMHDTPNEENQWTWALNALKEDKDSRQAIMHFNRPLHQYKGVKDFVCTLNAQFLIRDDKLNMKIMMRSNDIFFGLTYDLPFFSILQQQMLRHLKETYPSLEMGNYTHHAVSFHAYERNFKDLEKMHNSSYYEDKTPDLDVDLVFPNGHSSYEMVKLMESVEKDTEFESESNFLTWLYKNIKEG